MRVVDASTLTLLIDPDADLPVDPETGKRPELARERIDYLIETLDAERTKLIVPAPALSEVLVFAKEKGREFLDEMTSSSVFKVEPFDQRAAIEAAAINLILAGRNEKSLSGSKIKTKFDVQIVAIGKVNGADTIYSEDGDIAKLAAIAKLQVVRVTDLPLPPPKQSDLFEETKMDRANSVNDQAAEPHSSESGRGSGKDND